MNATTSPSRSPTRRARPATPAPEGSPNGSKGALVRKEGTRIVAVNTSPEAILQMAIAEGAPLEQLEKFMALRERHDANEARKAFNRAFAAFKTEAVKIMKGTTINDGPLKGKKHADLYDVVSATTGPLAQHGLTISWKTTKDTPEWMEVTCTLKHDLGHTEVESMGGAPDEGPGRNKIQARGSTRTYLQRYTAMAILGLAAAKDDNDGAGSKGDPIDEKQAAILFDTVVEIAGNNKAEQNKVIGGLLGHLKTKFKVEASQLADIPAKVYQEATHALAVKKAHVERERAGKQ